MTLHTDIVPFPRQKRLPNRTVVVAMVVFGWVAFSPQLSSAGDDPCAALRQQWRAAWTSMQQADKDAAEALDDLWECWHEHDGDEEVIACHAISERYDRAWKHVLDCWDQELECRKALDKCTENTRSSSRGYPAETRSPKETTARADQDRQREQQRRRLEQERRERLEAAYRTIRDEDLPHLFDLAGGLFTGGESGDELASARPSSSPTAPSAPELEDYVGATPPPETDFDEDIAAMAADLGLDPHEIERLATRDAIDDIRQEYVMFDPRDGTLDIDRDEERIEIGRIPEHVLTNPQLADDGTLSFDCRYDGQVYEASLSASQIVPLLTARGDVVALDGRGISLAVLNAVLNADIASNDGYRVYGASDTGYEGTSIQATNPDMLSYETKTIRQLQGAFRNASLGSAESGVDGASQVFILGHDKGVEEYINEYGREQLINAMSTSVPPVMDPIHYTKITPARPIVAAKARIGFINSICGIASRVQDNAEVVVIRTYRPDTGISYRAFTRDRLTDRKWSDWYYMTEHETRDLLNHLR